MKKIGVELGTAAQGHFDGVGIITVSIPGNDNEVFLLYPAYYSSTDKYPTISTGALRSSTKFSKVIHHANNHLQLISPDNHYNLPCTVIDGIDFIRSHFLLIKGGTRYQVPYGTVHLLYG